MGGNKVKHFKYLAITVLALCSLAFLFAVAHWSLVNDAALMRYVTFLLDHGFSPYRQIYDLNLPGSYLIDWSVKHLLGQSPLAWRVFDVCLLVILCSSMVILTQRKSHFAGLYAGLLFVLFHARDGSAQLGQRDLVIAVLLVAASAVLLLV